MAPAARILLVEDDPTLRTILGHMLGNGGFEIVEVGSGGEALAVLREVDVDLVVLDGLLPDMHGLSLARRLLDEPASAGIPICLVSGAAVGRPAMRAGMVSMVKPVFPNQLIAEISALLEWRRAGGSPPAERSAALQRLAQGFLVGP